MPEDNLAGNREESDSGCLVMLSNIKSAKLVVGPLYILEPADGREGRVAHTALALDCMLFRIAYIQISGVSRQKSERLIFLSKTIRKSGRSPLQLRISATCLKPWTDRATGPAGVGNSNRIGVLWVPMFDICLRIDGT